MKPHDKYRSVLVLANDDKITPMPIKNTPIEHVHLCDCIIHNGPTKRPIIEKNTYVSSLVDTYLASLDISRKIHEIFFTVRKVQGCNSYWTLTFVFLLIQLFVNVHF